MGIANLATKVELFTDCAVRITNIVGLSALAVIVLITTADILIRGLFNESILGVVEITEYAMIILVYLGLGWCATQNAHAKVDLMVGKFSPRAQAIIDSLTTLLSIVVAGLISWQGYGEFSDALRSKVASSILEIPSYPFYLCLGLGSSIFCIAMLKNLIQFIIKAVRA